jgi:NitT/TauT family transport system permease protein
MAGASRAAIGLALRISVVAEAFGGGGGIGYRLIYNYDMGVPEGVFAWALLLISIMILLDHIVLKPIEGWTRKWLI